MFAEYIAIEIIVLAVSSKLLGDFLRNFRIPKRVLVLVLFPLLVFVTGFSLRLSGEKEMIDLGFFFTEFSFLFVYLILAVALILGQIKYWLLKKH